MSQRIAVLADIHANSLALNAVFKDMESQGVTRCWFLGDAVGRGPYPLQTLTLLREIYDKASDEDKLAWLSGNHDLAVTGHITTGQSIAGFDLSGLADKTVYLIKDNQEKLKSRKGRMLLEWLNGLPSYRIFNSGIYLVHGMYVFEANRLNLEETYNSYAHEDITIASQVEQLRRQYPGKLPRLVMAGHTHVSLLAVVHPQAVMPELILNHREQAHTFTHLAASTVYINPGSVGFPRKFSPARYRVTDTLPTYAILTLDFQAGLLERLSVEFRQVKYDWRPYFSDGNGNPGVMSKGFYPEEVARQVRELPLPDGITFQE